MYRGTKRNAVTYTGSRPAKFARGTKGNPIVIQARPKSRRATYLPISRHAMEVKGVDTTFNEASVETATNTNGDAYVLNLIQQGNGSWNRVGRHVQLRSLRLKGVVGCYSQLNANTYDANTMRMVVVWDKQPSGAAVPSFDDIFGHTDQSGTETTTFLDPLKYDNTGRFSVVMDKTFTHNPCGPWGTGVKGRTEQPFDYFINLKNRQTIFSGQSTPMTIADISTGALYVYFRAKKETNDESVWDVSSTLARLRYTD